MRYAVLSDVHSNLEALSVVLTDIEQKKIGDIVFLGDAVGYGPSPNECIDLLAKRCKICIAGNHDWGVLKRTDITCFNEYASDTIEWTRGVLTIKNNNRLKAFPVQKEDRNEDILFVHSSPKEPGEWHYLLTLWDAEINFHYFDNKFCFLGHSHQPFIIEIRPSGELISYKGIARIKKNNRYIINAGSVGQPRDGDPRACYAIIDTGNIEIVRVPYNVERVQEKMRKEFLPPLLIDRLSAGI